MDSIPNTQEISGFDPYKPPQASLSGSNGAVGAEPQRLNPWFSMWLKPRATIQQIIDNDPQRQVLLLAAVAGFSETLDRSSMQSAGDKIALPTLFVAAVLAGPLFGIVKLYLGGALLHWTGGWLGGRGTPPQIRAAMAWSNIPVIWALLLWIPLLGLFGGEMFTTLTPRLDESLYLLYALIALGGVGFVMGVWAYVVYLKCLGQVQGFSAWRALGNTLLAMLVLVVPLVGLLLALR